MQRMQEAADNLKHADHHAIHVEEEEIVTFDDLPPSSAVARDRPWKSSTAATTNSNTDKNTAGQHSSATSVTSASNFLRETQKQHELEHPHSPIPNNNNSPPSLSQALKNEGELGRMSNNTTYLGPNKLESNAAKQFLWDDQSSITSGYTNRSNTVNLHDIKHSFRNSNSDNLAVNNNKGHLNGKGARWSAIHGNNKSVKEMGEGLWSALPLWGGGRGNNANDNTDVQSVTSGGSGRSSRYRDEEGERLLNLASERLNVASSSKTRKQPDTSNTTNSNSSKKPIVQNMTALTSSSIEEANNEYEDHVLVEEKDDDSFLHREGHRRVFLDTEGNLSYGDTNHANNGGNENAIHSRRMMNSYKRALKRPLMVLCAVGGVVAIVAGAGTLYTNFFNGVMGGVENNDGDNAVVDGHTGWNDTYFTMMGDSSNPENLNASTTEDEHHPVNENIAQEEDDEPKNNEAPNPFDKARFNHIRYTLINKKASPPQVFLDTQSAQFAALVWLTRDDARQLDPESVYICQRYGLAVIWFSTTKSGYEWHIPENHDAIEEDDEDDGDDGDEKEDDNGSNKRRRQNDRKLVKQGNDPNQWFRHDQWLSSDGICGWEGITCHPHDINANNNANNDALQHDGNNDGDVSHVELRRNNLHGLIPEELYTTLPYLRVLDLSDNGLAGTLSDGFGSWNGSSLEFLNLTSNNIAGSLTSIMGSELSSLKELHLANNLLVESIPHSIGTLKSLRHLDLSGNSLRGTIPYEIGELNQLSTLNLSWNLLVGNFPHELSELQTLVTLDVGHNSLGGPMISELSRVKYLTILRLNDNHFSGELPTEIGHLVHLDELYLNNNDFRGTLPAEISNLDGLDSLNVANNYFEGEFPPEFTSMAGLQKLDISSNKLRGEIPIFIDGMSNLRSLNMAHNDFSSSIPSELGSLYKLEYLYLDDNEFENSVPNELGELSNLKKLALHNNFLVGEVDDRICKLADDLFLTQLSADCGGEIPEIVCGCCICHDHEPIVHLNDEP
eukprot:CAMPEP_0172327828 /NCGR_PEP_ID=MMETSP1058-20130122/60032_1 /TAXON_ID=83371 /ORGANISM="Detonula confervacea, Strain CCMP 353" /LENGTH=1009 /DNA_ID=CAMNT_0013044913 /DNA_START=174 /DNA_END=3203 /DNA_ORIENTATION=-